MSQEKAIQAYRDSLLKGTGEMEQGSSEELIKRVNAAVKSTKKEIRTQLDRMLAVADPKNGDAFIAEVLIH